MTVVVDTGVLYALADKRDAHHVSCTRWLAETDGLLVVPPTVIAEACYLINDKCGAYVEVEFLASIGPGQHFRLCDLHESDLTRVTELVRTYSDMQLGGTDASVVAIAERLGVTEVATVDRRHFTVVRPQHVEAFTLLPG